MPFKSVKQRKYMWATDRNGKIIPGQPMGGHDHSLDGARYAITSLPKIFVPLTPKQKEDREFAEMIKRKKIQEERRKPKLIFVDQR